MNGFCWQDGSLAHANGSTEWAWNAIAFLQQWSQTKRNGWGESAVNTSPSLQCLSRVGRELFLCKGPVTCVDHRPRRFFHLCKASSLFALHIFFFRHAYTLWNSLAKQSAKCTLLKNQDILLSFIACLWPRPPRSVTSIRFAIPFGAAPRAAYLPGIIHHSFLFADDVPPEDTTTRICRSLLLRLKRRARFSAVQIALLQG